MRIVVLLKPVPDPGEERLGDDGRLDGSASAVINGTDEYVLEAALNFGALGAEGRQSVLKSTGFAGLGAGGEAVEINKLHINY